MGQHGTSRGNHAEAARAPSSAKRDQTETQQKVAKRAAGAATDARSIEGKSLNNPDEIMQAARAVLGARSAYVKRFTAADTAYALAGKAYTDYTHNGRAYPMHTSTMQDDPQYRALRQAEMAAQRGREAAKEAMLQAADKRVGGALSRAFERWNRGETIPAARAEGAQPAKGKKMNRAQEERAAWAAARQVKPIKPLPDMQVDATRKLDPYFVREYYGDQGLPTLLAIQPADNLREAVTVVEQRTGKKFSGPRSAAAMRTWIVAQMDSDADRKGQPSAPAQPPKPAAKPATAGTPSRARGAAKPAAPRLTPIKPFPGHF